MTSQLITGFILSIAYVFSPNAYSDNHKPGVYSDKIITNLLPEKPRMEVTVVKLFATGEDDSQYVLFDDPAGLEITMDRLGKVGEYVQSKGLVDGVYHTLVVELSH